MSESQKYSIVIAGRTYPLLVSKEEAKFLAELESTIFESITKLKKQYQHLDKQDCLSMALIQMALDSKKKVKQQNTSIVFDQKIEAIEKLLASI